MKKLEKLTLKELVNAAIIIEDQRSIVGGCGDASVSYGWSNTYAGSGAYESFSNMFFGDSASQAFLNTPSTSNANSTTSSSSSGSSTPEEMYAAVDAGTWSGGQVDGMGYVLGTVVVLGGTYGTITAWGGTAPINSDGSLGYQYNNSPEMQAVINSAVNYSGTIGLTEWEQFQEWNTGQPSGGNINPVCPDPITENLAWQLWQWIRN